MKSFATILLLFCTLFGLHGQSNNVVFSFRHRVGAEPLQLDKTVFSIWNGKKVLLTRAQFYMAEIELVRPDSTTLALKDFYILTNAKALNQDHPAGQWDIDQIIGLNAHIGVDPAHNHLDPAIYPEDHPLAPQKFSMHWGWAAGYRFIAVEGYVDMNNDGIPESPMQFHTLDDELYRAVKISGATKAENGTLNIRLDVDYVQLFDSLALDGSLIVHGKTAVTTQMSDNAAKKNFLKMTPPGTTGTGSASGFSGQVVLAPNPCRTATTVRYDLPGSTPLTLDIFDTEGRVLRHIDALPASGTVSVDASTWPGGAYRCVFARQGRVVAGKTLIVKH